MRGTARRARFIPVPLREEKEGENRGTENAAGGEVIAREKLDSNRTAVMIAEHNPIIGSIIGRKLNFVTRDTHQELNGSGVINNCREAKGKRNTRYHDNLGVKLHDILFRGAESVTDTGI